MSVQEGPRLRDDERALTWRDRTIGLLGPVSSSFTLAWLATHRRRLRMLLLGGHRLSVLFVWDAKGQQRVDHDDDEVAALQRIVYGPEDGAA